MKTIMAQLDIQTWNKKGSVTTDKKNLGSLTAFVDNEENYIHIDTKHGRGDQHTERDESEIFIVNDGTPIFQGTFGKLKSRLQLNHLFNQQHNALIEDKQIIYYYDETDNDLLDHKSIQSISELINKGCSNGDFFTVIDDKKYWGSWKIKK